ncbi:MAG: isoprenylcysteine carboxylmethyltransferase family protein [Lentimicrobiaceae bacterium]|jgi:protein-S-isoprenylcysteine O-methyltransferase Ste14
MKGRLFAWLVMIFGGAILGYYLDHTLFQDIYVNLLYHCISAFIGILLLLLVMRISKNTGRTLAKYGRQGNLKRMETNALVIQGAYKYMRHPMHLGLLMFPLSIAFLIGSPSFIIIIAPAEIVLIIFMIKFVEEPEAIRKFGDQYLALKKQVPWFCFRQECLKELLKNVPKN